VAVGAVHVTGPAQERVAVKSEGQPLITGAMLSFSVTVIVRVVVLPTASVAVNKIVVTPRLNVFSPTWPEPEKTVAPVAE
jgi:hypothetical protein